MGSCAVQTKGAITSQKLGQATRRWVPPTCVCLRMTWALPLTAKREALLVQVEWV
jgi:hypothetical protein